MSTPMIEISEGIHLTPTQWAIVWTHLYAALQYDEVAGPIPDFSETPVGHTPKALRDLVNSIGGANVTVEPAGIVVDTNRSATQAVIVFMERADRDFAYAYSQRLAAGGFTLQAFDHQGYGDNGEGEDDYYLSASDHAVWISEQTPEYCDDEADGYLWLSIYFGSTAEERGDPDRVASMVGGVVRRLAAFKAAPITQRLALAKAMTTFVADLEASVKDECSVDAA